jgi:hypothetical protein
MEPRKKENSRRMKAKIIFFHQMQMGFAGIFLFLQVKRCLPLSPQGKT